MKPKNIIIPSIAGFVLSFLISIIATHRFGVSLVRGLIFAAVFAAIAMGIMFLSKAMLDTGDAPLMDSSSVNPGARVQRGGGAVDITISDENLTEDSSGPQFNVSANKMPLGGSSASSISGGTGGVLHSQSAQKERTPVTPQASSPAAVRDADEVTDDEAEKVSSASSASEGAAKTESSFKPISLGTGGAGTGGKSDRQLSAKEQALAERKAKQEAEMREIDALPDLDGISSGSDGGDSEIIEDSDFASAVSDVDAGDVGRTSFSDGDKALSHNAETMAKAIQTLLKKES